jgi:hypothetical protein
MFASTGIVGVTAALLLSSGVVTKPSAPPPHLDVPAVEQSTARPPADAPVSASEMASLSGGEGVDVKMLTQQQLTGATTGNTVNAGTVTSGAVNFSGNALSGFRGIGNFVVNTGANNTLQGAINISVVTTPGP